MGPFIKQKNTTTKMMIHILISLIPIIIFAFIKNGIIPYKRGYANINEAIYPLLFIGISVISSYIYDVIFKMIIKKNIKEAIKPTYNIITGILLSLLLPINTPIILLLLGTFISTIIGKIKYGNLGKNIINPVIISFLFITLVFHSSISNGYLNNYELKTIPSLENIQQIGTYNELVKPFGRLTKVFVGAIPGGIGETSTLLCLIALAYLIYFKIIKWRIPVIYIATVFAMTYVIGGTNNLGIWYPLFQIFIGGLAFKAIFIAADTKSSPVTPIGQILYGMFLGILTVIFRYILPLPEGIIISILIMNLLVKILDKIGSLARFNFKIALVPFIASWILILGLSLGISMKYDKIEEPKIIENNQ